MYLPVILKSFTVLDAVIVFYARRDYITDASWLNQESVSASYAEGLFYGFMLNNLSSNNREPSVSVFRTSAILLRSQRMLFFIFVSPLLSLKRYRPVRRL